MMSQHSQHSQTNGASLEDCHTNFYALTDLCGIKWRVFTWESGGDSDPLKDPILQSYSRCLSADVLCVWRRTWQGQQAPLSAGLDLPGGGGLTGASTQPPALSTGAGGYRHTVRNSTKELWVFWYGDEPDMSSLISPELTKAEVIEQGGSWDWESGLSYECRTILFKALHNLIERCLLTRGFVRLGKWFVQPYEGPDAQPTSKDTHLSFCLSFFVHGESTVCASVDVRQHPPVRRLTKRHLLRSQQVGVPGVPVILAPYGMRGTLTGVSYKAGDLGTQKIIDDWKQFFPVEVFTSASSSPSSHRDSNHDSLSMPSVVEVISGGYKMRYPTCFVLVTDLDIEFLPPSNCDGPRPTLGRPTRESGGSGALLGADPDVDTPFVASTHPLLNPRYLQKAGKGLGWGRESAESVWQDIIKCPVNPVGAGSSASCEGLTPDGALTPVELAGQWEFADPSQKIGCSCTKMAGTNQVNLGGGFIGYKNSGVATPGSVPSLRMCGGTGDGPPPSVDSPASITPSPLPTPRTPHSQPAPPSHHDSSMPLLSPHQPPSNVSACDPSTPAPLEPTVDAKHADPFASKAASSMAQSMSPYPGSVDGSKVQYSLDSTNASEAALSGGSHPEGLLANGLHGPRASPHHSANSGLFRKPQLPESDYERVLESELSEMACIYDNNALNSWLHHPVKRFRPSTQKCEKPMWPPYRAPHVVARFSESFSPLLDEVKQEHCAGQNGMMLNAGGGVKRSYCPKRSAADPYDFEDDVSGAAGAGGGPPLEAGFKIKEEKDDTSTLMKNFANAKSSSTNEPPPSPGKKLATNLYTHEGLAPRESDLDDIFDSPIEDYSVQTPPGSNKPVGCHDDTAALIGRGSTACNNSKNGASNMSELSQLSKMYPTPPSLEHNPDHDAVMEETLLNMKHEPLDESHAGSYQDVFGLCKEEPSLTAAEIPFVYKPSSVAYFIGSDRYKPLNDLPSKQDKELMFSISPSDLIYNPSWQHQPHVQQQSYPAASAAQLSESSSHHSNITHPSPHHTFGSSGHFPSPSAGATPTSVAPGPPSGGLKVGMSPISPATSLLGDGPLSQRGPGSVGPHSAGPPANYELPSPASNHSSYLNKTLPSVEPPLSNLSHSVPEANSLFANLVLQDSSINLFRDHNFDSCTICVCNNSPKVVGNIKGSDGTLYLPPSHLSSEEEYIVCSCGFSAVVNRRLAYQSGLFYEDEVDLTGLHEDLVNDKRKPSFQSLLDNKQHEEGSERDVALLDSVPPFIFELVQSQSVITLCTPSSVLHKYVSFPDHSRRIVMNVVDYKDGNETAHLALDQAKLDNLSGNLSNESDSISPGQRKSLVMHKWCYIHFDGPSCSQDMIRCMKALQPFLQEAIQKKRSTRLWEPVYNVSGPLTWRQFHRMAVRGTEDLAEPLPIPLLLTGHERDWHSIAPQAIKNWEKLLLEPYSQPRNVAYVIVSPDNEFILKHVRAFFKELSSMYELCRLGRHAPIRRVLRDGIMRVNKRAAGKVANEALDDWFTLLGDSHVFTKLRMYCQICSHTLAPHLTTLPMDKSLFEAGHSRPQSASDHSRHAPSPMAPPTASGDTSTAGQADVEFSNQPSASVSGSTPAGFGPGSSLVEVEEEESPPPAIVVYLIDPFSVGADQPELSRLVTLGLMRCYKAMLDRLPETMRSHVYVQIVSLDSVLELALEPHDKSRKIDQLKSLAFSVFTQCRRSLVHASNVRSLTGFGPAALFDNFLRPPKQDPEDKVSRPYPVFSPAFILAPIKESRGRHKEAEEALGDPRENSTTLYCTYCLSEDQRWIIAAATDELGELLETVTINIEIPNRTRRKKASARRHGLKKLMDWILGVMSIGVHPWRLVIGRLGRIGHGELKGWLSLLSRKSLSLASKNLKDMCKQCAFLFPAEAPCVLSACLVSLEPDSSFRMMPDMFTPDERFGQNSKNCNLSTPQDSACTHILVFPTSATTQSAQQRFQDEPFEGVDEDLFPDEEGMDDVTGGMGMGMGINFTDFFMETGPANQDMDQLEDGAVQPESTSQQGSPTGAAAAGRSALSPSQYSGQARSNGIVMVDPEEDAEASTLQQQPLALGYFVSTSSTGKLPSWFWSSCPHLEASCPTFLKSALHLNQPAATQAEDYMHNASAKIHPLDSKCTADVLRFVLEGYNNLSWLVLDPTTQDRRSCLPLHMQVLSHLYNIMASLV